MSMIDRLLAQSLFKAFPACNFNTRLLVSTLWRSRHTPNRTEPLVVPEEFLALKCSTGHQLAPQFWPWPLGTVIRWTVRKEAGMG